MKEKSKISIFFSAPLLGVLFFHLVSESMVIPILVPMLATPMGDSHDLLLGFSTNLHKLFYGIALSLYPIAVFFCAPIIGALSDLIGRRKVLIATLAGAGLASVFQGAGIEFLSIWTFLLGRVLIGATAGVDGTIQATLVEKCSTRTEKNFYLGATLFAMCLGFIFGPAFSALFINESYATYLWAMPFYTLAPIFVLCAIMLAKSMPKDSKGKIASFDWLSGLKDIFTLRHSKNTRRILYVFSISQLGSGCFTAIVPLLLEERFGFSVGELAVFLSAEGLIGGLVFLYIGPKLLEKFSNRTVFLFSMAMCCISVILPFFKCAGDTVWVLVATFPLGFMLAYFVILAIFSEAFAKEREGWILSVLSSLWGLMTGAGLALCGVLAYFSNDFCLIACAIITIAGAIMSLDRNAVCFDKREN